jgi:hypothetical protein
VKTCDGRSQLTRFPKVDDLKKSILWWKGPYFLWKSKKYWPEMYVLTPDDTSKEEMKKEYGNFNFPIVPTTKDLTINRLNPSNYSVGPC